MNTWVNRLSQTNPLGTVIKMSLQLESTVKAAMNNYCH